MLRLFKKKSRTEQLCDEYRKLLNEAHTLSTSNRKQSDSKYAQADAILKKIDALENA